MPTTAAQTVISFGGNLELGGIDCSEFTNQDTRVDSATIDWFRSLNSAIYADNVILTCANAQSAVNAERSRRRLLGNIGVAWRVAYSIQQAGFSDALSAFNAFRTDYVAQASDGTYSALISSRTGIAVSVIGSSIDPTYTLNDVSPSESPSTMPVSSHVSSGNSFLAQGSRVVGPMFAGASLFFLLMCCLFYYALKRLVLEPKSKAEEESEDGDYIDNLTEFSLNYAASRQSMYSQRSGLGSVGDAAAFYGLGTPQKQQQQSPPKLQSKVGESGTKEAFNRWVHAMQTPEIKTVELSPGASPLSPALSIGPTSISKRSPPRSQASSNDSASTPLTKSALTAVLEQEALNAELRSTLGYPQRVEVPFIRFLLHSCNPAGFTKDQIRHVRFYSSLLLRENCQLSEAVSASGAVPIRLDFDTPVKPMSGLSLKMGEPDERSDKSDNVNDPSKLITLNDGLDSSSEEDDEDDESSFGSRKEDSNVIPSSHIISSSRDVPPKRRSPGDFIKIQASSRGAENTTKASMLAGGGSNRLTTRLSSDLPMRNSSTVARRVFETDMNNANPSPSTSVTSESPEGIKKKVRFLSDASLSGVKPASPKRSLSEGIVSVMSAVTSSLGNQETRHAHPDTVTPPPTIVSAPPPVKGVLSPVLKEGRPNSVPILQPSSAHLRPILSRESTKLGAGAQFAAKGSNAELSPLAAAAVGASNLVKLRLRDEPRARIVEMKPPVYISPVPTAVNHFGVISLSDRVGRATVRRQAQDMPIVPLTDDSSSSGDAANSFDEESDAAEFTTRQPALPVHQNSEIMLASRRAHLSSTWTSSPAGEFAVNNYAMNGENARIEKDASTDDDCQF
jgi:hypothetical protein